MSWYTKDMLYSENDPNPWYLADVIPAVVDVWNSEEISDRFLDNLAKNHYVHIAHNLTGCLCKMLDDMGLEYQLWYPKYARVMSDLMPVANFDKITI